MRIHFLAVLALVVPACAGDITSPGGGGPGGAVCGNGVVDPGEQCDDGNTTSGDGCSATCMTEQTAMPALAVTLDKSSLSTELRTTNTVMVTLTSSGGFTGSVTLAGSALDGTNTAITGWTIAFDNGTVTVPANGTATAMATLTIPSQNMGLTGTLKIDATSSLGTSSAMSAITVANQLSFMIGYDGNTGCVYPTGLSSANPVQVSVGTKVRFVNMSQLPNTPIVIHSNGAAEGICHEAQPGTPCPTGDTAGPAQINPNEAYEQTAAVSGNAFSWYCHSPGPDMGQGDPFIQVVN